VTLALDGGMTPADQTPAATTQLPQVEMFPNGSGDVSDPLLSTDCGLVNMVTDSGLDIVNVYTLVKKNKTKLCIFGIPILVMIGVCFFAARRSTGSQETKMPKIKVVFYGVLGDRDENRPDSHTAIVDPAGLRFIADNRPGDDGGASGAIYSALRIKEFPQHVRDRITRSTEAAIHHYDDFDVIHVVGPQLWREVGDVIHDVTHGAACGLLVQSYRNVFKEFGSEHSLPDHLDELRLLPISGGIFAGRYKQQLPTMSATAVYQALSDLKRDDNQVIDRLKQTTIKMCIFDKAEQDDYRKAFDDSNNDGRYSCVISAAKGQDRVVQV